MGDKIYVPYQEAESEFVEKRSRFIGHVWPVDSEDQAQELLRRVKKQHYDARHNCWCYLLGGSVVRYSDDGEPQGTAGQPMLAVFQREHVTNVLCVVTRYFGGIKLGAGGLIRAYSKSVSHALSTAQITKKQWMEKYEIRFSYDLIGRIDYYFREHCLEILDKAYDEEVCYTYLCDHDNSADFQELSNGKFLPRFIERALIEVPVTIKEQ